jgi:hypothetical protein
MSRGGKRPGAGRPIGAVAKLTATAVARAKSTGELPHEFLLRVVRGERIDNEVPSLEQRIAAAVSVAPYFAPKLAAIEQRIDTGIVAVVSNKPLSKEEFMKKFGIEYASSNTSCSISMSRDPLGNR